MISFLLVDTDKPSNSMVSPSASLSSPAPPTTPGSMRVISRADDGDAQDPDEDGGLHSHFVEGPAKYYIGNAENMICFVYCAVYFVWFTLMTLVPLLISLIT